MLKEMEGNKNQDRFDQKDKILLQQSAELISKAWRRKLDDRKANQTKILSILD